MTQCVKLFFDESALPVLERLFGSLGLEVVDQTLPGHEPWALVRERSRPASAGAARSTLFVGRVSGASEIVYDKGEGLLGPARGNLKTRLEER